MAPAIAGGRDLLEIARLGAMRGDAALAGALSLGNNSCRPRPGASASWIGLAIEAAAWPRFEAWTESLPTSPPTRDRRQVRPAPTRCARSRRPAVLGGTGDLVHAWEHEPNFPPRQVFFFFSGKVRYPGLFLLKLTARGRDDKRLPHWPTAPSVPWGTRLRRGREGLRAHRLCQPRACLPEGLWLRHALSPK